MIRRALVPGLLAWVVPALALASPQPTARRVGALLIPLDQAAEAQTLKLETYMEEALARDPALQVKRSDDLFGLPGDSDAELALKRADTGYQESLAAFNDRDYDDAERKLRATLKEYQKAAGAMTECGHYCDAIAMYGSVMNQRGEVDEARLSLLDLMALSPAYLLPSKVYGRDYISLRAKVGTSVSASLRASAMVKTRPAGARVYVDNSFVGFSPLNLPQVQAGKHLLRIERPGFKKFGRIVELSPEDQVISVDLVGTPAYKSFDGLAGKLRSEVQSDGGGQTLASLGQTLGLDRGVIGTVRQLRESNATELVVGLFDLRSGKRLSSKKVVFQGDEFGQLKSEAGHVVYGLLNSAGGPSAGVHRKPKGGDPLEHHSGMESWSDDNARQDAPKKSSGDPLDGVDGMEDW